jgi:hypothetical protein
MDGLVGRRDAVDVLPLLLLLLMEDGVTWMLLLMWTL